MSNQIMAKTYYCPTCKEFPDKIFEVYTSVTETRKWDGIDTYELVESDFGDVAETLCGICDSALECKEEG
jgi:hypothetical protein